MLAVPGAFPGAVVKVIVTVTREYEMDEKRVLREQSFDPPFADADAVEKRRWLEESFWELCGFGADQDHLDGGYVWNTDESADTDFVWPKDLP